MYFWDIKKLRYDLATGQLRNTDGVLYFLAILFVTSVLYELQLYIPNPNSNSKITNYRLYTSGVTIVLPLLTVSVAYLINKSIDSGRSFFSRLLAVYWVLLIRFTVFIGIGFLAFVGLSVFLSKAPSAPTSQPVAPVLAASVEGFFIFISSAFFYTLFAIRFWIHTHFIAKESAAFGEERLLELNTITKSSNAPPVIEVQKRIIALRAALLDSAESREVAFDAPLDGGYDDVNLDMQSDDNFSPKLALFIIVGALIGSGFGAGLAGFISSMIGGVDGIASGVKQSSASTGVAEFTVLAVKSIISSASSLSTAWVSTGVKWGAIFGAIIGAIFSFAPANSAAQKPPGSSNLDPSQLQSELDLILSLLEEEKNDP